MRMNTIIEKVSDMYRTERNVVNVLQKELNAIEIALRDINKTSSKHISLKEYNHLVSRKEELMKTIALKTKHYEGIHDVRELLMDLGFD